METLDSIGKVYYTILATIGVPECYMLAERSPPYVHQCCNFIRSTVESVINAVNLLAILILYQRKCGLSNCTTRYLVAMATADLLVIITAIILYRIGSYYFATSFLDITPVCSITFILLYAAAECSVWFTVMFSFDRFVVICSQKLKMKYCTERTAAVVLSTTCILLCLKDVPMYFRFEPAEFIDNVPWFCHDNPSYYTDPAWVVYGWLDKVLNPFIPYVLVLLFNALTVRYILVTSRVRQGLMGQSKRVNRSDPEMDSRRKSMILLFTISGSFILLWLLYVLHSFYYIITGINPVYYDDLAYILADVAVMLLNLNCCTNAFIYGVTQPRFRDQFKSAIKYPFTLFIQLINKQNN
ncbi:probable G-protein coupled receptor 139 [Scyliorhinus canicula]|uniref:probable G-protein coupled receptor 139 n=1 Tax=Scyliorhinus canicula TaxID=7830 RepID=UPI0018F2D83F|nr:probable G-protein coupled receptor 139 [Scyliorhinus canicula]